MFDYPSSEEFFPNTQSKPPLMQLEAIASHLIICYLGKETHTNMVTTSFQVAVASKKVSPEPSFLQTKPQFSQRLLIALVL